MRIAIDGSALGSGRGGDETLMRGILIGLAEESSPSDRFELFVSDLAAVPGVIASDTRFRLQPLAMPRGLARLAIELPLRLRSVGALDALVCLTHTPLFSRWPTVLIITDLSFHRHPEYYPWRTRARLNLLVRAQIRKAAAVATLSYFCKQDIVDAYGLDPSRVSVVPCGVDPPQVVEPNTWAEQEQWARSVGIEAPFCLYLGNLHARKNLGRLVQAMDIGRGRSAALAAHQLVVAGARWWSHEGGNGSSKPDGTLFLGHVSDDQREYLLREAAFLAYPSLFEGFGLPPVEAMLRGTPVIAGNAAAIPEVVGDAALLVDPTDVEDISRALIQMAQDPLLRSDLVDRGRRHAPRYTTAASGHAMLRTLVDVVPNGSPQRVR